jgi:hypothetical protein
MEKLNLVVFLGFVWQTASATVSYADVVLDPQAFPFETVTLVAYTQGSSTAMLSSRGDRLDSQALAPFLRELTVQVVPDRGPSPRLFSGNDPMFLPFRLQVFSGTPDITLIGTSAAPVASVPTGCVFPEDTSALDGSGLTLDSRPFDTTEAAAPCFAPDHGPLPTASIANPGPLTVMGLSALALAVIRLAIHKLRKSLAGN